jgi:hypothetical protein
MVDFGPPLSSSNERPAPVGGPMPLIRILLAALAIGLLWWAYAILDNIWNYNDSGTLTYITFAAIPGLPGLLLLYLSLRPRRGRRSGG